MKFGVQIHAWVFMTNHIHLLMTPTKPDGVSRCMQHLGRRYVRYFNSTYLRTGTLYEGRFKSSIVQSRYYLLACLRYIELNPVRAAMVKDPAEYDWSSYRAHALGAQVKMWKPHPEYLALGSTPAARLIAYRRLVGEGLDANLMSEIRSATNSGLVVSDELFRKEIEQLTGRLFHHLRRGPKSSTASRPKEEILL